MNPNLKFLESQALALLNVPYKWGGASPLEGMDCSGMVLYLLKSVGFIREEVDMTAQSLFTYLHALPSRESKELGAIAFYGASVNSINHTAFVLSEYQVIEAMGDSTVLSFTDAMKWRHNRGALIRTSPIRRRNDLVAIIRPVYQCLGE